MSQMDEDIISNLNIITGRIDIPDLNVFLTELQRISSRFDVVVQAVNADLIAGKHHVVAAVEKAQRSMNRDENISSSLGMEILLYLSGRRHIDKALEMGASAGKNNIAIIMLGDSDLARDELRRMVDEDPGLLEYTDAKKDGITIFFDITEPELEAVGEEKIPLLVLDRVALLDVQK